MKKLNITPGEWSVSWQDLADETTVYKINDGLHSYDTAECNNELIADAGTTYNQCGLLPSELLKQRDELLKKLKDINMILGAYPELEKLNDALVKRVFLQLERVAQINNAENI